LNIPGALAMTWDMLKDKELSDFEKHELLLDFDKIFGLDIASIKSEENDNSKYIIKIFKNELPVWTSNIEVLPQEVKLLIEEREEKRRNKEWEKSDEIRDKINKLGWQVEDSGDKTIIKQGLSI